MTSAPIPLTAINGGMTRLRIKGAARRDSLYQLSNGYVTAGNTVKVRPGTLRNVDLSATTGAGATKGLVGFKNSLHVFSSSEVPVPAGYTLHVLSHPAVNTTFTEPPNPASSATGWNPVVESLLHFEDGNGSTTFTDSGTNPSTWTAVGSGAESTTQAKFGTGSMAFKPNATSSSGSGAAAPFSTGSNLDIFSGNGDFTVEFWVWPTSGGMAGGNTMSLLDYGFINSGSYGFWVWHNGAQVSVYWSGSGGNINLGGTNLTASSWNHIAVVRDNDTLRLFVNGVSDAATGNSTGASWSTVPGGAKVSLGRPAVVGGSINDVYYMDDVRITKGACLYGGPFFVPTASATTSAAPTFTIAELLHFDDGNGSTAFKDSVGSQTWAAQGAAVETTAQFKLGTGSGQFLHDADYIKTSVIKGSAADITNDVQNFSWECFYRPASVSSGTYVIADLTETASGTPYATGFRLSSDGPDIVLLSRPGGGSVTASGVLAANTWVHIAVTARGTSFYLWINGVLNQTLAGTSRAAITTGARHFIGSEYGTASTSANGYIDEVRLVTGCAVYLANFTPPAAPYAVPTAELIPLKEIHFAAPFMGFLYVSAEFDVSDPTVLATFGSVFHYWIQDGNTWEANKDYTINDIVVPSVPNGFVYVASRASAVNPVWSPSVLHTEGDVVEPTTPNGFFYTAIVTEGSNPISGTTEPTWPLADNATVTENSAIDSDQAASIVTAAPQPSTNVPNSTTVGRYGNLAGGFSGGGA